MPTLCMKITACNVVAHGGKAWINLLPNGISGLGL